MTTKCRIVFLLQFPRFQARRKQSLLKQKLMDYSNKVPLLSHLTWLLQQAMTGILASMDDITMSLIYPCIMDEGSLCSSHIVLNYAREVWSFRTFRIPYVTRVKMRFLTELL